MGMIANYKYLSDKNLNEMKNFSMKACKKADLYPNIWDFDEEEDIKEEISNCFNAMKDFYRKILEVNENVMVTIY